MKQLLLTTLLVDILGCLVTGIIVLFSESSSAAFIYAAVMTFWSIFLPSFVGVLIYQIIKRKIIFHALPNVLMGQIVAMILLFVFGLIMWTLFDLFLEGLPLTITNMIADFKSQFSAYVPAGIIMAIALPFIDKQLRRREFVS